MAAFEYRQALEIRDARARHQVKYLFIGKSGAILLGYPDTTQDADLFIEKSSENGERLVEALRDLGFSLSEREAQEIRRGKVFVQLKNGPFDLDLIFAPDGIERFGTALIRLLFAACPPALPLQPRPFRESIPIRFLVGARHRFNSLQVGRVEPYRHDLAFGFALGQLWAPYLGLLGFAMVFILLNDYRLH